MVSEVTILAEWEKKPVWRGKMAKFHAPDPFDFTQAWPAWRQRFSPYQIASKLNLEDGDVQVNALLYAMGKARSRSETLRMITTMR